MWSAGLRFLRKILLWLLGILFSSELSNWPTIKVMLRIFMKSFVSSFICLLIIEKCVFSNVHAKEVWSPGLAGLRFERSGFEVWPGYCVLVHCFWCDYCLCCLGVELQEFIPSLESLIDGEELKNTGLSENATFHFLLKSGYERMERAAVLSL